VQPQRFTGVIATGPRGRVYLPVPFDPDAVWGLKTTHRITGTVNGNDVRGPLQLFGATLGLSLGPAWRRDCGVSVGDQVDAVLKPEGPQQQDLPEDIAQALAANPGAATFFDSLATFYRTGYLRWINATTRRPDLRAARIADMITLLAAGQKQRPQRTDRR
jgi:Bacteriocin-protection, YdeI or OmpD-Associated/Domain of unknown function (DUF1905)